MTMASYRSSGKASIAGTRLAARPSNQSGPGSAGLSEQARRSQRLGQSMEGRHRRAQVRRTAPFLDLRMIAVASAWLKHTNSVRQPSRPSRQAFSTATRLCRCRPADDLRPAPRAPAEDLSWAIDACEPSLPPRRRAAQEAMQLDGGGEECVDALHVGRRQPVAARAVAEPPAPRPVEGASRVVGAGEGVRVEDDLRRDVRPEQRVRGRDAREVDVRERNGVGGPEAVVAGPVGERLDRPREVVLGGPRLRER
jgi:hypothetical protein